MQFKDIVQSKNFRHGIEIAVAVLVLLVVFGLGVFVGVEKTQFSYHWGENYYRNFTGPQPFFVDRGYMNAHGAAGVVLKIDDGVATIKDNDGDEKNIVINNKTLIKRGPADIAASQLQADDNIVVIGSPDNQGEIQAQLIRVMPGPPPANHSQNP